MKVRGKVFKYGDNIDTDVIIPARYLNQTDPKVLAKHCMEDITPSFSHQVKPGDIIVAERNFGCGSSREHAPIAIKTLGISCVIASSFARIFYRNAINVGLPVIQCDTSNIEAGDELELDLAGGTLKNLTRGFTLTFPPLPGIMRTILDDGGLVAHIEKHGDFKME